MNYYNAFEYSSFYIFAWKYILLSSDIKLLWFKSYFGFDFQFKNLQLGITDLSTLKFVMEWDGGQSQAPKAWDVYSSLGARSSRKCLIFSGSELLFIAFWGEYKS